MKKALIASLLAVLGVFGSFADDYALAVPKGWIKKESAAKAQYHNGTGTFILTIDTLPTSADTPDSYVQFVKEQLKGAFKDISFGTVINGEKDAYDTRDLKYSVIAYGMTLKYDVLYVFVNDKAYTLTTSNLAGAIDKQFLADIDMFFSGFKIK